MRLDELTTRPPIEVFKDDGKSRVWRVADEAGTDWVVKRWQFARWRQRLRWCVRCHPAQAEHRRHRALIGLGLPVMPVEHCGWSAGGCLVTPYRGLSLYNWLRLGGPSEAEARAAMYDTLGTLIGRLFKAGVYHRDFKASNLIVGGESGGMWLIDAGTAKRQRGGVSDSQQQRMLEQVWANLLDAATYADDPAAVQPNDTDRQRMERSLAAAGE